MIPYESLCDILNLKENPEHSCFVFYLCSELETSQLLKEGNGLLCRGYFKVNITQSKPALNNPGLCHAIETQV